MNPSLNLEQLLASIPHFDQASADAAQARQNTLTKPQGSLGDLEKLSIQIAGITANLQAPVEPAGVVLAAASHGICEEGVSAFPTEVTAQMVGNFLNGKAAINALARNAQAEVFVVDAGVGPSCPDDAQLHQLGFGKGTANFAQQPAMTAEQAQVIIERGAAFSKKLCQQGIRMISLGEMGIGNTTAAAAITAVITDSSPSTTTGRGTMIDDATWNHKVAVIENAIAKHLPDATDAIAILSSFGGYETGFLCGCILGAAACRMPIILDGYPTTSAALLAALLHPGIEDFIIAGHCSTEPGHRLALDHLGLSPLLKLSMRLGEGSGATLAIPIVRAAVACLNEMATFEEAAVAGKAK
ncbi:MAG: nicotinate-nucleotide--dimethylbenzimidazole phosphoribosyltransferase [Verrucomicrobiales bacterium]|nr:nicotinate-nucleotide--dimethylbenzimidazole phosphoribosyltransferase [Verrucomicrobiales bacterium]